MKPKYTSKHDEVNNETFYYRDSKEIDRAEETTYCDNCGAEMKNKSLDPVTWVCPVCGNEILD